MEEFIYLSFRFLIILVGYRQDKGAGNLLTCLQFIAVIVYALQYNLDFKNGISLKKLDIPFRVHLGLALIFVTLSVLNNYAFAFHISQPIHMVFRSSSLLTTFLIGLILKRK